MYQMIKGKSIIIPPQQMQKKKNCQNSTHFLIKICQEIKYGRNVHTHTLTKTYNTDSRILNGEKLKPGGAIRISTQCGTRNPS